MKDSSDLSFEKAERHVLLQFALLDNPHVMSRFNFDIPVLKISNCQPIFVETSNNSIQSIKSQYDFLILVADDLSIYIFTSLLNKDLSKDKSPYVTKIIKEAAKTTGEGLNIYNLKFPGFTNEGIQWFTDTQAYIHIKDTDFIDKALEMYHSQDDNYIQLIRKNIKTDLLKLEKFADHLRDLSK